MARSGVRYGEMLKALNVKGGKLDEALKYLLVHDYLYRDGSVYRASFGKAFDAAAEREKRDQITKTRIAEHEALIGYLDSTARDVRHLRELPGRLHRARKRRSEHRGGSDSVLRRTTWGNNAAQGMGLARTDQAGVADEAGLGAVRRLLFCSGAKGQGGEIHHRVFLWRARRCIE